MVHLTICLPTRNRQAYCTQTIEALAASEGSDFEVLVADNSDDPAPLADFFASTLKDSRFRLIPPAPSVLSMVDNWERLLNAAQGRWISVIGDDDYLDPRVTGLIRRCEVLYRNVDSISWDCMTFQWPDNRPIPTLASIPMSAGTAVQSKTQISDLLFGWSEGKRRPSVGTGIYHGAVRKSLMERIKHAYGGRYFEHPNVDWENTCKVVAQATTLVHCERPFSVLGACAASNSAAHLSRETMQARLDSFERENTGAIRLDQPDFPFSMFDPGASLCLSIATTIAWFCRTYEINQTGFGANFALAAMDECKYCHTQAEYDAKDSSFSRGFALWEDGKWAGYFKPAPFKPPKTVNQLSGLANDTLHIRETGIGPSTPAEFYRFGEHAIMPVSSLLSGARVFAP
ncbi:Glycosyltransferase like family 2 [Hoeflea sp. IMCC20628]|uniref:glycosyltransferase family 2 protein n=1 Tax=Hoeflea sp. IMCC20628 TaxID=1620421 RepID=UPI00063AB5B7|nr:glycosyltransferase family 2 protein [Hoeflea sp. IMCC20628]AKI01393.1 Glycosyltransferase like family 2 [Hoeflea sp. IMCC20628]